jgi:D-threo-aldose 1-dehydrogenase
MSGDPKSSERWPPATVVDLRTAALQFSAAADVAVALVVGARSDQQIQENYNSLQAKIQPEFWADLKQQGLIEANAALPAVPVMAG